MSRKVLFLPLFLFCAACGRDDPKAGRIPMKTEVANEYYVDPSLLTPFPESLTTFVRRVEIDQTLAKYYKYRFAFETSSKEWAPFEKDLRTAFEKAGYQLVDDEKKARVVVEYLYRTSGHPQTSDSSYLWFFDRENKCLIAKVNYYNHNLKKQEEIIRTNNKKMLPTVEMRILPDRKHDLRMMKGKDGMLILPFLSQEGSWSIERLFRPDIGKSAKRVYLGPTEPAVNTLCHFPFEMDNISFELATHILNLGLDLTPRKQDAHIAIEATLQIREFGEYVDKRRPILSSGPGYHFKETIKITSLENNKVLYSGSFEGKTPEVVQLPSSPRSAARDELQKSFSPEIQKIKRAIKASSK